MLRMHINSASMCVYNGITPNAAICLVISGKQVQEYFVLFCDYFSRSFKKEYIVSLHEL